MDNRNTRNFIYAGLLVLFAVGLVFGSQGLKSMDFDHFTAFSIDGGRALDVSGMQTLAAEKNVNVEEGVYGALQDGKAQLIVEFRDDSQTDSIMSSEVGEDSFRVIQNFDSLNAAAIEVDGAGLEELISSGNVRNVYNDEVLEVQLSDSTGQIGADYAWNKNVEGVNIMGNGQSVCLIDTGVDYNNAALSGRVVAQKCFCSVSGVGCCPNGQTTDDNAMDNNGHGTHVAGIISSNDLVYRGIAPEANIVAVKVCNAAGSCSSSGIISALQFCTENAAAYGISAVSISIGGTTPYSSNCDSASATMTSAINNAVSAGMLVSIASGNYEHLDAVSWPSCVQKATTVSAVDKDDVIADYSNRAWGVTDIIGVGGSPSRPINSLALSGGFTGKYGTSMAAPHVAAAVTLIQQYSLAYNGIKLSTSNVEGILKKTGKAVVDSTGLTYYRIDIKSAIDSMLKIDSSDLSVAREGIAKIKFDDSADLGLASYAFYSDQNLVGLDSSAYPSLNVPATLTLYNLSFEKTPVVMKSGIVCSDCSLESYENGTASFHVSGFSNYSCAANSNLRIWDSSYYGTQFYSGNATLYKNTTFYGEYKSLTSGLAIENASCVISFPDGSFGMEFDSPNGLYNFSREFSSEGDWIYNISCSSESAERGDSLGVVEVTKAYPSLVLKVNGQEADISVLKNVNVVMNASMADPAEDFSVYIDGNLVYTGRSFDNVTSFGSLGSTNLTAVYGGSLQYHSASKTIIIGVIEDTVPPQFSNFSQSEVKFGEDQSVSVKVNDNIGVERAWIETLFSDGLNHSATALGNGVYGYNISGLAIGNYSYVWHANDSSGNQNSSDVKTLSVIKGNNPIRLYLNGQQSNLTVSYGTVLNVSAMGKGNVSLYRNGVIVNNPDTSTLNVNSSGYFYSANSSGNENYTQNSSQSLRLIVNRASSDIDLKLDGRHGSTSTAEGDVEIDAEMKTPSSGTVKLYKGSTLLDSGSSPINAIESFTRGTYTINASYEGTANYLPSSEAFTLTITAASTSVSPSSSGGSTSALTSSATSGSCTEQWRCAQWSDCSSGSQTRTCYDLSNCGTSKGKPSESQSCANSSSPAPALGQENQSSENKTGNQVYTGSMDFVKSIYGQIYDEPIIVLPILGVIVAGILFFVNEWSIMRARLKKHEPFKKSAGKTIKNEMHHLWKRH